MTAVRQIRCTMAATDRLDYAVLLLVASPVSAPPPVWSSLPAATDNRWRSTVATPSSSASVPHPIVQNCSELYAGCTSPVSAPLPLLSSPLIFSRLPHLSPSRSGLLSLPKH